jgi:hypothetical protein
VDEGVRVVEQNLPEPGLRARVRVPRMVFALLVCVGGCATTSPPSGPGSPPALGVSGREEKATSEEIQLADLPPLPPAIEAADAMTIAEIIAAGTAPTTTARVIRTSLVQVVSDAAAPGSPASPAERAGAIALETPDRAPPPAAPGAATGKAAASAVAGDAPAPADPAVTPAQCTACGGAGRLAGLGECVSCGGSGLCVPGQKPCYDLPAHTFIGRFFNELYHCLCCPDPCYQPTWVPEANSAFFMDFARPQTLTRFRVDGGMNMQFPDRSEYFWAQAGLNRMNQFKGTGPMVPKYKLRNGRPIRSFVDVDWTQLSLYQEIATSRASFFVDIPYRSWSSLTKHSAGFSDMNIGTKSMLLDCELVQITFQFRTYFPIGSTSKGLGNGHTTLEPSLLFSLHVARQTYIQGEISEWIPLTTDAYAGAIFMHHASLNQVVWRFTPDVPLIAMIEYSGWTFQDGAFSTPVFGPVHSAGETYVNVGPSVRLSICNRLDFGAALAYPVSDHHWADPMVRGEVRLLY